MLFEHRRLVAVGSLSQVSDQDIARQWNVSVRVSPAGGTGVVRSKEQDFDFGFVIVGPVKAAYVTR